MVVYSFLRETFFTVLPLILGIIFFLILRFILPIRHRGLATAIALIAGIIPSAVYVLFGMWPYTYQGLEKAAISYDQPWICTLLDDDLITSPSEDECLRKVAYTNANLTACNGIYCMEEVIDRHTLNIAACNQISSLEKRSMCQQAFVRASSAENVDATNCEGILYQHDKEDCLSKVAAKKSDVQLCLEQKNIFLFEQCYQTMTDKIDLQGMENTLCPLQEEWWQEWCYFWFAVQLNDPVICEHITLSSSKEECLREAGQ